MRRLSFFLLVSLLLASCDDTELNSPVIQAEVDGQFYRSVAQASLNDAGEIGITGSDFQVLNLRINGNEPGVYPITSNSATRATFLREGQLFITSGPDTGGEIVLDKVDEFGVSGSFFFTARLNGLGQTITFSRGVFFNVPFVGGNQEPEASSLPDAEE